MRLTTIVLCLVCSTAAGQDLTVNTYAGRFRPAGLTDGPLRTATFGQDLSSAVADSDGNLYVADVFYSVIRKISPAGEVTTLAGAAGVRGTADGRGFDARFYYPASIAADGNAYVYVSDQKTIRRITPAGIVTTLAGTPGLYGSSDGIGAAARFNCGTCRIAADSNGNVYVADNGNFSIRKITTTGVVTTWAGSPLHRGSADGTGTEASFSNPDGVAIDGSDNVYVADTMTNTIRKITPAAVVTTLSTSPPLVALRGPIAVDQAGTIYVVAGLKVLAISANGNVTTVSDRTTFNPMHLSVGIDGVGNFIVTSDGIILRISPTGTVTTISPVDTVRQGDARDVSFSCASAVAADPAGNIYVADWLAYVVHKVSPAGVVSVWAGAIGEGGITDGPGDIARFAVPGRTSGLASDAAGNLFVTDAHAIRKIAPDRTVTTFAGDVLNGGDRDGIGRDARLYGPQGIAIDSAGNLYVTEPYRNRVRKVTPDAVVTTIGTIQEPRGIAMHRDGTVYVESRHAIWKMTPSGNVLVAGGQAGTHDGLGAEAQFCDPPALAFASNDDLYIADGGGCVGLDGGTIRKMTPAGLVTTVAGSLRPTGNFGLSVDGRGSAAVFIGPVGLTMFRGGIYVADQKTVRLARSTIDDVAIVDTPSMTIGGTCHFDTAPQTATAWGWTVTRCPAGSTADLSSYTQRNPTFTPDVAGLYTFQLLAGTDSGARFSTRDLTVAALMSQTVLAPAARPLVPSAAHTASATETWSFVASVTGGATGNVWFADNGVPSGSVRLTGGVASFSMTLQRGTHSVTARYEGDQRFDPSTSNAVTIPVGLAATSTTVTSSQNPSQTGSAVTLTATVTGNAPTGTVQFFDGTTPLGSPVVLAAGVATLTTSALTSGTHTLTGVYSGDANNASSTSPLLTQSVTAGIPALSGATLLLLAAMIAAAAMFRLKMHT